MVLVSKELFFKKYNVINFSWNLKTSNIIKSVSQSHWAHTGIIVASDEIEVLVLESTVKGVVLKPYTKAFLVEKYKDKTIEIVDFNINPNKPDSIWKDFMANNKSYGFESYISLIMYKLGFSTNFDVVGTVICSELVSKLLYNLSDKKVVLGYKEKGTPSEYDRQFWRIEPKHISLSRQGERLRLKDVTIN